MTPLVGWAAAKTLWQRDGAPWKTPRRMTPATGRTRWYAGRKCWCGSEAREEAIGVLETLGRQPYGLECGWLRLDPDWDPLRGDPRFEALVAALVR